MWLFGGLFCNYKLTSMKTQKVYLPLPILNLRSYHPIACSGKPQWRSQRGGFGSLRPPPPTLLINFWKAGMK